MDAPAPAPLLFRWLGRRPYEPIWQLQRELAERLTDGDPDGRETLLAVEHDSVITLGRRGKETDVLLDEAQRAAKSVALHRVERGGEVTYHGPGQLVLYPIVRVLPSRFGVGTLVRNLAFAIAERLAQDGIDASYDTERPGLWVGDSKIAALGMRVARGVSMHGAALNVSTDLKAFDWIVPCGLPNGHVTSMLAQLGGDPGQVAPLESLAADIAVRFARRLGFRLEQAE